MASKYNVGDRVTYVGDWGKRESGTVESVVLGPGTGAHYRYDVRMDYDGPDWLKGAGGGGTRVYVPEPDLIKEQAP